MLKSPKSRNCLNNAARKCATISRTPHLLPSAHISKEPNPLYLSFHPGAVLWLALVEWGLTEEKWVGILETNIVSSYSSLYFARCEEYTLAGETRDNIDCVLAKSHWNNHTSFPDSFSSAWVASASSVRKRKKKNSIWRKIPPWNQVGHYIFHAFRERVFLSLCCMSSSLRKAAEEIFLMLLNQFKGVLTMAPR